MFDYFYGGQAELFSFYRIPKVLFTDARIRGISCESKVLYGLLLDRMSLSIKSGWLDKQGRVYIIFTADEIMEALCCADNKATKLMKELEGCGLIERKRRGLGKPSLIYVKNFISDPSESRIQSRENHDSGAVKTATLESLKSRGTNTNPIDTDSIETDPFLSGTDVGMESEGNNSRARYQNYFLNQLNFNSLITSNPEDEDMLNEMLELLVDTVCSNRKMIRIAGDDKPYEVVKGKLMKLESDHIRFVLMCMKENTTQVRNMKQYLLAALYNAPLTMYNYYASRVQHDLNPKPAKY
ncbi:MAG TPA: replication initiator protein A [Candidatus Faecalibacterium avium]|nr:replication initiator protein A [Candidatus Faecalibacterium avium]